MRCCDVTSVSDHWCVSALDSVVFVLCLAFLSVVVQVEPASLSVVGFSPLCDYFVTDSDYSDCASVAGPLSHCPLFLSVHWSVRAVADPFLSAGPSSAAGQ